MFNPCSLRILSLAMASGLAGCMVHPSDTATSGQVNMDCSPIVSVTPGAVLKGPTEAYLGPGTRGPIDIKLPDSTGLRTSRPSQSSPCVPTNVGAP